MSRFNLFAKLTADAWFAQLLIDIYAIQIIWKRKIDIQLFIVKGFDKIIAK